MKRLIVALIFLFAAIQTAHAAERPRAHFEDPEFGFSLDVPSIGGQGSRGSVQRLMVFGAPANGFAPNCNVQIQHTAMGLDAYIKMSRDQFKQRNIELVATARRTVSGLPASTLHYRGTLGGRRLEFSALAVAGRDRVWLLTCTARADSFKQYQAPFARVVDSFKIVGRSGRP